MTKDEAKQATPHADLIAELMNPNIPKNEREHAAVRELEAVMQAITAPENQPSQFGTVTLDYHLAKIKEWEDRFESLNDKALAQPAQKQRQPLTEEQAYDLFGPHYNMSAIRAVEAAHGIKEKNNG